MSATANDSDEYYCFRVKEDICKFDNENIVIIPCSYNFNLKKLRTELWKQFGVPRNRRIFYIDDDGDDVPIESECEFREALKLAKNAFIVNTAIPLIVGPFHMPMFCSDEESSETTDETYLKESKNINGNPISSFTEKNDGTVPEPNSGTVPPPWFTEYMEAMKKDMVSAITHEVVKNVKEVFNKHLDSLAYSPLKEPGQSRSQSYSSLSKRHPRCSCEPNEKNQKRMRSQDEEQSSDASIERVDEPHNESVNTAEDSQPKKDMISTISEEVVKEMTEMLNRIPLDPLKSVPSKKHGQSRSKSHLSLSKRFSRYFDSHSSEKNQKKTKPQDGEQSSDDASMEHLYESRNVNTADVSRQEKLSEFKCYCATQEEKKENKNHQRIPSVITKNNLNGDIEKEQSQNNAQENFFPPWKNLPLPVAPLPYNETMGMFENELRMSCSVTGNQILNGNRCTDSWYPDNLDDKTSVWSHRQEDEDDDYSDAFEIIHLPISENKYELFTHAKEPAAEQRRHDSNWDSPSFELLSESPSPTPACCMHFNEEHFSTNEKNPEQQTSQFADMNPPTSSIYVVDINGKIYNEHQLPDHECVCSDLEKRPGGVYSFVTENLPVQDTRCSKLPHPEQRSSEWKKSPRDDVEGETCDNANNSYDDVRNSHTTYLTVRTHCDSKTQSQCSCQSQTALNDFTQSFHSHTTSVTDTTDIYTETYGNGRSSELMLTAKKLLDVAKGIGRTTATATVTTTASPKNDHDVRVGGNYMKETKTNERHCHDAENYPECFCAPHSSNIPQGTSVDPPYQSGRSSGSSDKSSPKVGSRKTSAGETPLGSTDSVHLLPETLVTAAGSWIGSLAYDAAREVFDKIRAHTDSIKRVNEMRR